MQSAALTPLRYPLGPGYNEFGYYEHPAITSNFFSTEGHCWFTSKLGYKRTAYNEHIFMN